MRLTFYQATAMQQGASETDKVSLALWMLLISKFFNTFNDLKSNAKTFVNSKNK